MAFSEPWALFNYSSVRKHSCGRERQQFKKTPLNITQMFTLITAAIIYLFYNAVDNKDYVAMTIEVLVTNCSKLI
jgi:hypothetical protein